MLEFITFIELLFFQFFSALRVQIDLVESGEYDDQLDEIVKQIEE